MKILVDSSIWIDYFSQGKHADRLDAFLDNNLVCTCGVVLAEHIPYLKLRKEKKLIGLLENLPEYKVSDDWVEIMNYQYVCLRQGINKVGLPDLLLVATIKQHKLSLLTADKHFLLMHKCLDFNLML